MGWDLVPQVRVAARPAGEVRVSTARVGKTTLLTVVIGQATLRAAGMHLGDPVRLLCGSGEHAGWVAVERTVATADARSLGKMPGTQAGQARFRTPEAWGWPMVGSTGIPEDEIAVQGEVVRLRLPPLLRGDGPEVKQQAVEPVPQQAVEPPAASIPEPALMAEPPPPPEPRATYRTEARSDLLRRLWPDPSVTVVDIRARMARLEGPEIPDGKSTLYNWAGKLGLPSMRTSQPGFMPPALPALASPTVAPSQARPTDGIDSRASIPAAHPDKAEAVSMLKAGQTARFVAEEFGLPVATVATWAAEVRAQAGRAA